MAEVFRARPVRPLGATGADAVDSVDPGSEADVVVKRMLPQLALDPRFVDLFAQEARIASHLRHPNIVRVFDFGTDGGQLFLAMELVDGLDGFRLVRRAALRGTTVPFDLAIFVATRLLDALEHAHENQLPGPVVHRDISPSNIYLSRKGEVKLGDFGIAKIRPPGSRGARGEQGTPARGKLAYLAPEQVTGRPAEPAADLFSTAVVLVEMLLGEPLFGGGSDLDVLLRIRKGDLARLVAAETSLPAGLMSILVKALAREPQDRYRNAAALRAALDQVLRQHGKAPQQADLGRLVTALCEDAPLAARIAFTDAPQPPVFSAATPASAEIELPKTPAAPPQEFVVKTVRGEVRGPLSYGMMIEWVATGRAGAEDQVSRDGRAYQRLQDVADLARHLPRLSMQIPRPRPVASLAGDFAQQAFVGVLARLVVGKKTGLLDCLHPPVEKHVYLHDGCPDFVSSNLAEDLLGEYLVKRGALSRGELDMALAVLPRFDGRLGDTLVALGLVEPIALVQLIAEQIRGKLLELFRWRKGRFEFFAGEQSPADRVELDLDAHRILVDGVRFGYDADDLVRILGHEPDESALLVPVAAPEVQLASLRLPDAYRESIRAVRGPVRIVDLLAASEHRGPEAALEGRRALVFGIEVGLLAWA